MNYFADLRARIDRSEQERGAILVLTALVMLLMLFIAAFSTDLGAWYRQTEEQQRAADVGSLNGIATFDRTSKAQFASLGATRWTDLTPAQQQAVEAQSFQEAVAQVQALLETSGLVFSSPPAFVFAAVPNPTPPIPGNADHISTATLTADDGSVITITRGFAESGTGLNNNPTFVRFIDVSITREGEQYFSNILRDAPEIERSAQSLLSNCGAVCDNEIILNPPFVGFAGTGNGDGYGPLLYDRDDDGIFDEAWAVNHHSNGSDKGEILCRLLDNGPDGNLGDPCPGGNTADDGWQLRYQTGNRPIEFQADDGKIYFAARRPGAGALGIACFDPQSRDYCSNEFIALWNSSPAITQPAWIHGHGPFEYQNRLYVISQHGEVACATLDLQLCGPNSGPHAVPGADTSKLPPFFPGAGESNDTYIANGEQNGSTLIVTQDTATGVQFSCLDLSNASGVVSHCGQHFAPSLANGVGNNLTFTRYAPNNSNPSQNTPNGVCVLDIQTGNNVCVDWSAGSAHSLSGLGNGFAGLNGGSYGGDAYTWNNQRTFFAGGDSNRVGCWNWNAGGADGGPCTDGAGDSIVTNNPFTSAGDAFPYGFNQISDRCVLGLGHKAVFFSFNPVGFGPCVDVQITTDIIPCDCEDENAGSRWGAVTLPAGLLADVTLLEATITLPDGTAFPIGGATTVDLLATDGVLDLTGLNDISPNPPSVSLTLDADSAIANGRPVFDSPYPTNLEISTAPTLTE